MNTPSRLPSLGFYLSVLPTAVLSSRLVWEQTALSWAEGPQIPGAVLLHSTLGLLLAFATLAGVVWSLALLGRSALAKRPRDTANVIGAAVVLAAAALVFVPYGWWVQVFATRIASGPHASEFLVHMSALGDRQAAASLIARGVPVNAASRAGLRPIEAAQHAGQPAMREFLASVGGRAASE